MKVFKFVPLSFIVAILALLSFGCAAVLIGGAAGAGAIAYSKGELKSTEKGSIDEVWDATVEATRTLNLTEISQDRDGIEGKIIARAADDDKVEIELEEKPNQLTEVKIRIGTFGDEDESRMILEEIRKNLS